MKSYWLVKQEPSAYSWDDLVRDGRTSWTGVRNFTARNNLRAMQKGDEVLFYHSVVGKAVVGVAKVARTAYPDPTAKEGDWSAVDLAPEKALASPVTLEQIKAAPEAERDRARCGSRAFGPTARRRRSFARSCGSAAGKREPIRACLCGERTESSFRDRRRSDFVPDLRRRRGSREAAARSSRCMMSRRRRVPPASRSFAELTRARCRTPVRSWWCPNYHDAGESCDDPQFVRWLRDLEADGHEIVIHGYFHQRPRGERETLARAAAHPLLHAGRRRVLRPQLRGSASRGSRARATISRPPV